MGSEWLFYPRIYSAGKATFHPEDPRQETTGIRISNIELERDRLTARLHSPEQSGG
jgi:hypothetical protein